MKEKWSIYVCRVDSNHRFKGMPGQKVVCPRCGVQMKEQQKGIITK